MKRRELKYRINWRDVWKKMRSERIRNLRITYDKDFQIVASGMIANLEEK